MNTYIINLHNKPGFGWVTDDGETEIVEASSLEEALNTLTYLESVWNDMYETLEKNINATFKPSDLIPLKISITELPATGKMIASVDIQQTLQKMLDIQRVNILNDIIHQQQLNQQKMSDVAKVKAEMSRLGLTPEDLK